MIAILSVTEALLIVTALSMDAFVSSFAYGADRIKIPFISVIIINVICSAILALSLFFGRLLGPFLPPYLTMAICFVLLLGLGISKLFDSAVKAFIQKHNEFSKKIRFSAFNLRFILNIYAHPEEADMDNSRILSPAEAAYLAVALSLDGLAVGFGAGITDTNLILIVAFSLLSGMLSVMLGCWLGNRITRKLNLNLTWLSGALLILLAFLKLV